jgi:TonB family protein
MILALLVAGLVAGQQIASPVAQAPSAGVSDTPTSSAIAARIAAQIAAAPKEGSVAPGLLYMPPLGRFYPAASKRAGEEGTSQLRCTLRITGTLAACVIARSSGSAALDAAALRLSAWARYSPQIVDRKAVESQVLLPVRWVFAD